MSTERPPYPDEWLSAYVDGELDADEQARVAAWLRDQPEAAARVAAWRADREALLQHFAPALDEPVPSALRATVWRHHTPRWALAAAAAGLLLAGAALGALLADRLAEQRHAEQTARLRSELATRLAAGTADGWVQRAAYAHTVYVAEPRHAVEVKAQEEHLARWLTRRIELPVKLFDLSSQGFELVGGRLLPDGPGKSAQLMYQRAGEPGAPPQRVTVYLRKPEQGADTAFRYEQQGRVGLFYWVEEGAGYALVGELPRATLLALAQAIYDQHPTLAASPATTPAAPPAAAPPASR